MSRTIRRTGKKPNNFSGFNHTEHWYFHHWVYDDEGRLVWKKKEGKDLKKAWWDFHNDTLRGGSYPKAWRRVTIREARVKNKNELAKYFKNPEYEIMDHEPRCLSWDYY